MDSNCVIFGFEQASCIYSKINCPPHTTCNIYCDDDRYSYECKDSIINCNKNAECNLFCSGHESCKGINIKGNGLTNIICEDDGYDSCNQIYTLSPTTANPSIFSPTYVPTMIMTTTLPTVYDSKISFNVQATNVPYDGTHELSNKFDSILMCSITGSMICCCVSILFTIDNMFYLKLVLYINSKQCGRIEIDRCFFKL